VAEDHDLLSFWEVSELQDFWIGNAAQTQFLRDEVAMARREKVTPCANLRVKKTKGSEPKLAARLACTLPRYSPETNATG
jgi:hypothetical protein